MLFPPHHRNREFALGLGTPGTFRWLSRVLGLSTKKTPDLSPGFWVELRESEFVFTG